MKRLFFALMCLVAAITASAQIGYQVSLLNNATGEPRANERVTVTVKILDTYNNVLCNETKIVTTNDFGVVSMTVGSENTFKKANWANLPFFIEATVDNRLIGKSQLLSVPVAEHAKHTGTLTKEHLCSKTWKYSYGDGEYKAYNFSPIGYYSEVDNGSTSQSGKYVIDGNSVFLFSDTQYTEGWLFWYCSEKDSFYDPAREYYYK